MIRYTHVKNRKTKKRWAQDQKKKGRILPTGPSAELDGSPGERRGRVTREEGCLPREMATFPER
jgi:hypothetical protein